MKGSENHGQHQTSLDSSRLYRHIFLLHSSCTGTASTMTGNVSPPLLPLLRRPASMSGIRILLYMHVHCAPPSLIRQKRRAFLLLPVTQLPIFHRAPVTPIYSIEDVVVVFQSALPKKVRHMSSDSCFRIGRLNQIMSCSSHHSGARSSCSSVRLLHYPYSLLLLTIIGRGSENDLRRSTTGLLAIDGRHPSSCTPLSLHLLDRMYVVVMNIYRQPPPPRFFGR